MKKIDTETLYTPFEENIGEIPWDIYPRPQMKRDSYICLNGKWELAVRHGAV